MVRATVGTATAAATFDAGDAGDAGDAVGTVDAGGAVEGYLNTPTW